MPHQPRRIVSLNQTAVRLGLSRRTVERLCAADELHKFSISSRRVGIYEDTIDAYVEKRAARDQKEAV